MSLIVSFDQIKKILKLRTSDLSNLSVIQETSIDLRSVNGFSANEVRDQQSGQILVQVMFIVLGQPLPIAFPKDSAIEILEILDKHWPVTF